jgi:hypothetical protein
MVNGVTEPSECKFNFPKDIEYFDEPWKRALDINESSFDMQFNIDDIPVCKKEDVLEYYKKINQ